MSDAIDSILAAKKQQSETAERFYSILKGEGISEEFLELRFRNGAQLCFSYKDLSWFNFSPDEGMIDLTFGGFVVTIKGRGLAPNLFNAIKGKRVAWIREADNEMQDSKELDNFIEALLVSTPVGFGEEN